MVEGADEKGFLDHVRRLLTPRGCGLAVTIKNAHGKGAANVLQTAIIEKRRANTAYDRWGVFFDTDTEDDNSRKLARKAEQSEIVLLRSEPNLEALLIALHKRTPDSDTLAHKKQLAEILGGYPPRNTHANWSAITRESLYAAAETMPIIRDLRHLLKI